MPPMDPIAKAVFDGVVTVWSPVIAGVYHVTRTFDPAGAEGIRNAMTAPGMPNTASLF